MKKVTVILALALVALTATACGEKADPKAAETASLAASESAATVAATAVPTTAAAAPATQASATQAVAETAAPSATQTQPESTTPPKEEPMLTIEANGNILTADFEDNSSAEALIEQLKSGRLTLRMSDYGGFEKVGDLPFSLVTNDTQITTQPGDVILYQGNKLTIYYGTNTWSFTRVARIRNADSSLHGLLGEGDVDVTLSLG